MLTKPLFDKKKPVIEKIGLYEPMIERGAGEALEEKSEKSADQSLICIESMIERNADETLFEEDHLLKKLTCMSCDKKECWRNPIVLSQLLILYAYKVIFTHNSSFVIFVFFIVVF